MKRRIMNSLGLGAFGAIGLNVLFYRHGCWFESASGDGLVDPTSISLEPTVINSVILSIPFAAASLALLSVLIYISKSEKALSLHKSVGPLFPLLTFVLMMTIGAFASVVIPLASNWCVWMTILIYGGICGFAHQVSISSIFLRKSVDFAISMSKNETLIAKSFELEHNLLQAKLQWLVWGTIIFVTAGIVTVLFNPLELVPRNVFDVYVINALWITTWCFIGILLGILLPLSRQMGYLRDAIVIVSSEQ